jgi:hypothetical protein
MGRNLPDYAELDLSKREADDYQKLMKTWTCSRSRAWCAPLHLKGSDNKNYVCLISTNF